MRRRLLLLSVFLIAALQWQGCDSGRTPAEPELVDPFMEIIDGTHVLGNQNFFFLPPLVPDPSQHPGFDAEAFDPTLSPVVEICQTDGQQCLDPQDQTNGFPIRSGVELPPVTLSLEEEHYGVNWPTHLFVLGDEILYRIRVLVAGLELGYADVDAMNTGKELKNVDTGQFIALLDGRTLPIKFRIQVGAVTVVGPEGGTVIAPDGGAALSVPPEALASDTGITIRGLSNYPDPDAVVAGTVYDFGPDGLAFDPPATLTIHYPGSGLPAGIVESRLRLLKLVGGTWQMVPGSSVDPATKTVRGPVDGFSSFGAGEGWATLVLMVQGGQGSVRVSDAMNPEAVCTYMDAECTFVFPVGTSVTMVAEEVLPDFRFEDWSGTGSGFTCADDLTCVVAMDEDREVTARFSSPGLISIDVRDAAFSMVQGGASTPSEAVITILNYGGRAVHLEPFTVVYAQRVGDWLDAAITGLTLDPGTSQTLTLSVPPNTLPPGVYTAVVVLTDGGDAFDLVSVTLTVTPSVLLSYDGTGKEFGPLPLIPAVFTSADGSDIYPVGAGEYYIFSLFDTGSDIVYIGPSDAAALGIGPASTSNPHQDTRIRVNGLSAIDPTTLLAPIGPHGSVGGAEAEVLNIRVGPRTSPWDLTLIGTPVANEVVARIDNVIMVDRGPYAFCGGCDAEGPDITFYMPTDPGIPEPTLQLPLERFGSGEPASHDGATNGQKYFMNGVTFSHGANAVADDPSAVEPIRFWFDTGAPPTVINTRVATALGLDLVAGGSFDCWTSAGEPGLEGYVIDRVAFVGSGPSGPGTYEVTNAAVCVDVRDTQQRQHYQDANGVVRTMDATIGANLFVHVPILFHGKDSWLGILLP